jgi:hypothetical protein
MSSSIGKHKPIDTNIPVVTPAGGTSIAYEDPNSPESIMKKATEINVQAIVDQQYDTQVNPYESIKKKEGFNNKYFNFRPTGNSNSKLFILLIFLVLIFYLAPSIKKYGSHNFILIGILISIYLFFISKENNYQLI